MADVSSDTDNKQMIRTNKQMNNERLRNYYAAERAVLSGQSYTVGNRSLTRANLAEIRAAIDDLLSAGASLDDSEVKTRRSMRVVFHD